MNVPNARKILGRLKCLQECIKSLKEGKSLPEALCYIPAEIEYKATKKQTFKIYESPQKQSKKTGTLNCTTESTIFASGDEFHNSQGKWLKLRRFKETPKTDEIEYENDSWILLYSSKTSTDELLPLQAMNDDAEILQKDKDGKTVKKDVTPSKLYRWQDVVEQAYSLLFPHQKKEIILPDKDAVQQLRETLCNWSLDHDETLVAFMKQYIKKDCENLGCLEDYVESLEVSSCCADDGAEHLTDENNDTYWESDGSEGQHWIKLRMKRGTVIKKLALTVLKEDDNYMPTKIVVQGGEQDNLKILNTVNIDCDIYDDVADVTVLSEMTEHYPIIMIRIKDCKGSGIDTRIRGIKLSSTVERNVMFDRDLFKNENLVRFPLIESYSPDQLYRRSTVLLRLTDLIDDVLPYIVPAWEYSLGTFNTLEHIRQLLPLSKKRLKLIDRFLKESQTSCPEMPKLYINRRLAMEHKADPSQDTDCKNSVFIQVYDGLKPRDKDTKPLDYRWGDSYDQWWECKFVGEGIIDQGGGFRDSISDLADELSPSNSEDPVPLPFFIRSPNQSHEDSNINKDVYILNPSCLLFDKYEWLGQMMGACLRSKETLVLTIASCFWKKLVGERINWTKDYSSINEAEVRQLNQLEAIKDPEAYTSHRTWSTILSGGQEVVLKDDGEGNALPLKFEDREEYCKEVKELHMLESEEQVRAVKRGLLKVVPQAVLDLMTWQELEKRVCGDPEITIEALRKNTHYDEVEETDTNVKYLWEALNNFSNEDRSRYLKFITGRRRLPAPVYISGGKGDSTTTNDALPESATCANMLFLPNYSSAKILEEKLRYAAYNCVAIDTDTNVENDYDDDNVDY